ncbi:methyltransferase family protein [Streptococcus gordonii]|uniref:methyltransferase family protein n=1 Tax=Streptococcus gordonii TaxID=1302 RepID=UPI001CC0D8A9|nr:isoprenylcysteine carboxylmethyltransferase family protein [Streptococcus gordonii]MBZ2133628.1 isoprenylcysteine carboxylmethyltransferase family protein [Streptococcus gordonii]MBZ2142164.1 isoprenylcysteine carboxylmethyltransferase family protein [Streptococcus gordonii]MBZ2144444.1 isoprenylcysteine carboxylmethyltransferase family protein [Streptococcus gordonii]MBZ2146566.1 isoprenylcysteine carboxylmethyltransferase family protein [Streptococcus gordonii]
MLAVFLLIPFLLIRFPLLSHYSKNVLSRAAYFAPVQGKEKIAYMIYQLSNLALFLTPFLLEIKFDFSVFFYAGIAIYLLGLTFCAISMRDFARPAANGMNKKGLYRYSRNPMYVAYFVCFLGIVFLTKSMIFFLILVIFQTAAHWIILSEERWCLEKFGKSYQDYQDKVRRYF